MTSVENLFTNTTNRFSHTKTIIISQPQQSFTPIGTSTIESQSIQSKNIVHLQPSLLQPIPQTYSQLQARYNQLSKHIIQATHEKQLITMLFQKVFLMESGKEQRMKKRFRRKKTQIQSKHACQLCSKIYSSSTSLARHAKLKHSYSMLQPPLRNYQIPPQPNSAIESCDLSKPDETELNPRNHKERKFVDREVSQSDESCSSESFSEDSSDNEQTPFEKGLS